MEASCQLHSPAALPPGKVPPVANGEVDGLQSRFRRCEEEKMLSSRNRIWAVQPVARHYTDRAIATPLLRRRGSFIVTCSNSFSARCMEFSDTLSVQAPLVWYHALLFPSVMAACMYNDALPVECIVFCNISLHSAKEDKYTYTN
jgi:hypothetical protein